MKKILITGNSGYIGSHLTKLLENDYIVHGLDINDPQASVAEFYQADITGPMDFDCQHDYDAIIHLAALVNVGESQRMPISYYATNMMGTMNVLNRFSTPNFIFASTGAAEGCASAYGVSKRAAEDVVREYCTVHNPQDFTIFRFYNVIGSNGFGPTNPDGLMFNLINAPKKGEFTIFGDDYNESTDGTCVRDYVHVMEICEALKEAIEKSSNKIECLGHGVGHTVKQMVDMFQTVNDRHFNVKVGPRREGDLATSVLKEVSPYMKNLYTLSELLKVDNK